MSHATALTDNIWSARLDHGPSTQSHRRKRIPIAPIALCGAVAIGASSTHAGGMYSYEIGGAEVGLAAAGYAALAQDASTVFTNPAGMTRLDGTQIMITGQLMRSNSEFSIDEGTSSALGTENGGRPLGSDGWLPGGGMFISHSLSEDLKLGFALAGNFGAPLDYDDDWAGRYYVQETTLLGASMLPSLAWKATDKLSVGVSLRAMLGFYENQIAINNADPGSGDGQLEYDDTAWGWGANIGLLYEVNDKTRLGFTWNSEVELDFDAKLKWSNLTDDLENGLDSIDLLDASLDTNITAPQTLMASLYTEVNEDWAILGNIGWQEWSRFGRMQLGIDNTLNPSSVTTDLNFKDTWHVALGARYRLSQPWLLDFGVSYDSDFQDSDNISPLMPVNGSWRYAVGAQQQLTMTSLWGFGATYIYGGTLETNLQSDTPVESGGHGDLVGAYKDTATILVNAYYNWRF